MSAGAARTQRLLAGPILPTLLKLAAPNLVLMLVIALELEIGRAHV